MVLYPERVSLDTKSRSINRVHLWQNLFNIEALSKRLYDLSSCSSSNKYCIHTLYNIMVLLIHTIYTHEYPAHNNPHYHCIIASIHLHRAMFTLVMLKIIYILYWKKLFPVDSYVLFRFSNKYIHIMLQMFIVKMKKKHSLKLQTYQDILFFVFH